LDSWPNSHRAPPARNTALDKIIAFDGLVTKFSPRLLQSHLLLARLELGLGANIVAHRA
jgi:hypothetical protein